MRYALPGGSISTLQQSALQRTLNNVEAERPELTGGVEDRTPIALRLPGDV
jgi:hypothetical protein